MTMRHVTRIAAGGVVLMTLSSPLVAFSQQCPPELALATSKLAAAQAAQSKPSTKATDVQVPRSLVAAREVQAPRSQDVQAPRSQDVQAPRSQDVQAPRSQDVQAPRVPASARDQDTPQTKLERARALIAEAEQACKAGNPVLSKARARAAIDALP